MSLASRVSGVPAAVLSAFTDEATDEENLARHGELLDILLRNGFSPLEARGEWDGLPELCLVVPGLPESELVSLGAEFGQEAVVYVENGEPRLLRT